MSIHLTPLIFILIIVVIMYNQDITIISKFKIALSDKYAVRLWEFCEYNVRFNYTLENN